MSLASRRNQIGISVPSQDLQGKLTDAGTPSPDQDPTVCLLRYIPIWLRPRQLKAKVPGEGMPRSDEVVWKSHGLLHSDISRQLAEQKLRRNDILLVTLL